jgi:chromosome segregation ATPase
MKKIFLLLFAATLAGCQSFGYAKSERQAQMSKELFAAEKQVRDLKGEVVAANKKNVSLENEMRTMLSEKESFDARNAFIKQEAEIYRQKAARLENIARQTSSDEKDKEFARLNEDFSKLEEKSKLYEIEIRQMKQTNAEFEEQVRLYRSQIDELEKTNAELVQKINEKE